MVGDDRLAGDKDHHDHQEVPGHTALHANTCCINLNDDFWSAGGSEASCKNVIPDMKSAKIQFRQDELVACQLVPQQVGKPNHTQHSTLNCSGICSQDVAKHVWNTTWARQHHHSGVTNDLRVSMCDQPLQVLAEVALQVLQTRWLQLGRRKL